MIDINKIEAVTERDMDLLLLEEFSISAEFGTWFYNKTISNSESPIVVGAWHSVTDQKYGESDLIVLYNNETAILIEDKIDAVAQPEQGDRYFKRGEIGIDENYWKKYITCMIAPKLYIQKEKDSSIYNSLVCYEEIYDFFLQKQKTDKRSEYKAYIIKEAIEQNRRGNTITPNEIVTIFWQKYWELSIRDYTRLGMKKPGLKPTDADWPIFKPAVFKKELRIVHKLDRGVIDLEIAGAANKLEKITSLIDTSRVEVVKASKSGAIRIQIGQIDRHSSFEAQKNLIINAFDAACKLLIIGERIQKEI